MHKYTKIEEKTVYLYIFYPLKFANFVEKRSNSMQEIPLFFT